ncbi:MAG: diacylglycerol kinase [Clostridia bacterium]|nr:diacylglycerol kinase [Clostridia bacterium]
MKKRGFGFKNAFCGICHAVRCERNFRVHIVAVLTVIYFGCVFGITKTQWAILALVMGAVPAAELVNTAIEAVVDRLAPEKCVQARIAKDCAAGAVLVLAVFAVIIAGIVFSERAGWVRVWEYIKENYIYLIVFAILSVIFVFAKGER